MATIELNGVEFRTRKRTNKVRASTAELTAKRQQLAAEYMRTMTEVRRLDGLAEMGSLLEADPENMALAASNLARIDREQDDTMLELALLVLVDPDDKPPTQKVLDEYADLGELDEVVKVALGEQPEAAENPTTAPPVAS